MAPFHFQIECVAHHSVWALEAVKTGVFAPPALVGPIPFADLRAMIAQAETALKAFTPDEVNAWSGKELDLQIAPATAFTPETFLLSFSLPNFHFHAVTAYDILRTRGVPLGKRDYEGRLRTRLQGEASLTRTRKFASSFSAGQLIGPRASLVCHEGTYHLWRRVPPGEKSIGPEADERRRRGLACRCLVTKTAWAVERSGRP